MRLVARKMMTKTWLVIVIAVLLMLQLGFFEFYLQRRSEPTSSIELQKYAHHLHTDVQSPVNSIRTSASGISNAHKLTITKQAVPVKTGSFRRTHKALSGRPAVPAKGKPVQAILPFPPAFPGQSKPAKPSHPVLGAQGETAQSSYPAVPTQGKTGQVPDSQNNQNSSRNTGISSDHSSTVTGKAGIVTLPSHANPTAQSRTITTSVPTEAPIVLTNWRESTFCHDFFVNTFELKAAACANSSFEDSVVCFGNRRSSSMATCVLRNIAVSPDLLAKAASDADYPKFKREETSLVLLNGADSDCVNISSDEASHRMERGDIILKMIVQLEEEKLKDVSECSEWINETVLFFTAHRFHIYFRILDYFNVHRLLEDALLKFNISRIIRISGNDNYKFPWFDQALFPETKVDNLKSLKNVSTCFKSIVLSPKSYASPVFQCKNRPWLRTTCMECDGKGKNETHIATFRNRVLKACSHHIEAMRAKKTGGLIVLISRTPYLRNSNDKLNNFERVMDNEMPLARALRGNFSNSSVHVLHLEELDICEQVAYAHNADIYLGVHGSGLVHMWWMRDEALVYEMEPHYELANPTFKMLARLSGRNYHHEFVTGGWKTVHSDIDSVISNLKKFSKLEKL